MLGFLLLEKNTFPFQKKKVLLRLLNVALHFKSVSNLSHPFFRVYRVKTKKLKRFF